MLRNDLCHCSLTGTLAGWRNGPTGILQNSVRTNAKSCVWDGLTPGRRARQENKIRRSEMLTGRIWWNIRKNIFWDILRYIFFEMCSNKALSNCLSSMLSLFKQEAGPPNSVFNPNDSKSRLQSHNCMLSYGISCRSVLPTKLSISFHKLSICAMKLWLLLYIKMSNSFPVCRWCGEAKSKELN